MKIFAVLSILFFIAFNGYGQNPVLSGTVKDKKGIAVPGAGVYISCYKIATVTDADGHFSFNTLGAGNYDILTQAIGFTPGKTSVTLENKNVNVKIVLEESVVNIKEVVIMPDANRQRYINLFKEFFIGRTINSAKCKLTNPQVLNISFDDNILTVTTTEFLVIDNPALGYRVKYLLKNFEYNYKTRTVYYEGYPVFEEMEGSKSKQRKWAKAREAAYLGSTQHFFRSLYNNTAVAEGYVINKLVKVPNKERLPDSVIESNLTRLRKSLVVRNGVTMISDSLAYWTRMNNKPKTMNILNRAVVVTDTLVHTYSDDIKYINYTDDLFVMYTKEKEEEGYENTGYWLSRPLDVPNIQISQIQLLHAPIAFYANGSIADPTCCMFSGNWAYEKVGDQVPMDYVPPLK